MRRLLKLLIAFVTITAILLGLNYRQFLPSKQTAGTDYSSDTSSDPFINSHGHQIASIVYLDANGMPPDTIQALKDMHASEVYLYVAYHSDAYFKIPENSYGLVEPADTLNSACDLLHKNNFRVIAVISSALIDPKFQTSNVIEQSNSSIINPQLALPYVKRMVSNLMRYPVDGIYVGEPYWTGDNKHDQTTPEQRQAWFDFYSTLIQETYTHQMPMYLVLPDLYAYGVNTINISGVPEETAKLAFKGVGIDLEDAYQGFFHSSNLKRFSNGSIKSKSLNPGSESIVEVSLRKGDLQSPIPPDFFDKEFQEVANAHIDTVLIFANEWWLGSPYRTQYKKSIESFLRAD